MPAFSLRIYRGWCIDDEGWKCAEREREGAREREGGGRFDSAVGTCAAATFCVRARARKGASGDHVARVGGQSNLGMQHSHTFMRGAVLYSSKFDLPLNLMCGLK